jgi:hypothetical protein
MVATSFASQVVDTHRDVERKAVLQMLAISLPPPSQINQGMRLNFITFVFCRLV